VSSPNRPDRVRSAVDRSFEIGMHQHRGEIEPFAHWIADRRPHHVIEIGTLHGGTAALWHQIATGTVVSVDLPNGPFGGSYHGYDAERCFERDRRLRAEFPRIVSVHADSRDSGTVDAVTRRALRGEPVDLLFIDGDHTYETVRGDYETYLPHVRPGGVVAFHDVLDTFTHRAAGCRVDRLWGELPWPKQLFSVSGAWGGIGAVVVPSSEPRMAAQRDAALAAGGPNSEASSSSTASPIARVESAEEPG
jgi:methyltransferase family protein